MRKCKDCNEEKPLTEFASAGVVKNVEYRRWKCVQCYSKQKTQERRSHARAFLEYKKLCKCVRCGISDHRVLDFHHRDGSAKLGNVSDMVSRKLSWENIYAEIAKCDCLCANCHRIEHFEEENLSFA